MVEVPPKTIVNLKSSADHSNIAIPLKYPLRRMLPINSETTVKSTFPKPCSKIKNSFPTSPLLMIEIYKKLHENNSYCTSIGIKIAQLITKL